MSCGRTSGPAAGCSSGRRPLAPPTPPPTVRTTPTLQQAPDGQTYGFGFVEACRSPQRVTAPRGSATPAQGAHAVTIKLRLGD
jgi:hypothetical protein